MKPKVLAVIPTRFQSRRFPGKALTRVAGKPLLQHIYEEALQSKLIDKLVVATDSKDIKRAVEGFGGHAVLTSQRHRTGSDRAAEVMEKLGGQIVINIQADHMGLSGYVYDRILSSMLNDRKIEFATLARKADTEAMLFDPNRVKLIMDSSDYALWFSRFPLPFLQGVNGNRLEQFEFYYHVGVYFFRNRALKMFHSWRRTPLEKAESLEQLRILENNRKIKVFKIKSRMFSVDTPEDLIKVEKHFLRNQTGE
jgi:3-deoxy-manno-octulosonate cytidylyltransferase (CMP-KDO synthetase)